MSKAKFTLTLIISLIVLGVFALLFQQYNTYFEQRGILLKSDDENRQLLKKIEEVLPQKAELSNQLTEINSRYESLCKQLPDKMQEDDFRQNIEAILKAKRLKILARREIHYSRPTYNEVKLVYSLKGKAETVRSALSQIKKLSRIVVSDGPEKESKENTGLEISIFSVMPEKKTKLETLECLSSPDSVWLPVLKDELHQIYHDYQQNCQTLKDNAEFYADMQRYRQLNESVLYLENIRDSLVNEQ